MDVLTSAARGPRRGLDVWMFTTTGCAGLGFDVWRVGFSLSEGDFLVRMRFTTGSTRLDVKVLHASVGRLRQTGVRDSPHAGIGPLRPWRHGHVHGSTSPSCARSPGLASPAHQPFHATNREDQFDPIHRGRTNLEDHATKEVIHRGSIARQVTEYLDP